MPSQTDIDPERLQADVEQIKDVIGIRNRYPGQRRMWLIYGGIIGLVSIVVNLLFVVSATVDLPNAGFIVIFFTTALVIGVAQWLLVSSTSPEQSANNVDWRLIFGALVVALLAIWSTVAQFVPDNTTGAATFAYFFSHVVVFLGLAFLLTGTLLKTERIRRRDRLPFYVGGTWITLFGVLLPRIEFLHYWGIGIFGILFLVHGTASYTLTSQSDD